MPLRVQLFSAGSQQFSTSSPEPMTPKYTFMGTQRLQIGKTHFGDNSSNGFLSQTGCQIFTASNGSGTGNSNLNAFFSDF